MISEREPIRAIHSTALIILALFAIAPSVWWVLNDHSVWPWDQAWYGEVSADLWSTIKWRTAEWPTGMMFAQVPKAPGLAWLGQFFIPLGEQFSSVEIGLMLMILMLQFASLVMIGLVGRTLGGNTLWISVVGVAAMASAPLFAAMSHQYLTEALQCCAVTYFYWIAARSDQRLSSETLAHLLLATGLALAAKTTSPLYCFLPALLALADIFGQRSPSVLAGKAHITKIGLIVGASGTVLLILIAMWYWFNFNAVLDFVRLASSGDAALDYGRKDFFLNKLGFWIGQAAISLTAGWTSWILLLTITIGVILRVHHAHSTPSLKHRDFLALAALIHIVLVLMIFAFQINEETRYLLPLLPALVVLLMWSLVQLKGAATSSSIVLFSVLVAQWSFVHARSFDLIGPSANLNAWVKPYEQNSQGKKEISDLIALTSTSQTNGRYIICGVELPWLNANSLAFFAAKQNSRYGFRSQYTSLGYAEKDIDKAWERLNSLDIVFYISIEAAKQTKANFINQTSLPVLERIEKDVRFSRYNFESKQDIIVYKNNMN
jgi:hypothetical protein